MLADGERNGAHLIGRSHVDAVHFTVRRHRREVNHPRREDDRQGRAREHPHQRAKAADAAGCLPLGRELRKTDVVLREVARADERQAVAGRPGDEIERRSPVRVVKQIDERRRLRERFDGRQRPVEEHATVVEPAQVDAHSAGIDADDARHG